MIRQIYDRVSQVRIIRLNSKSTISLSARMHKMILCTIAGHGPVSVEQVMRAHIEYEKHWALEFIKETEWIL